LTVVATEFIVFWKITYAVAITFKYHLNHKGTIFMRMFFLGKDKVEPVNYNKHRRLAQGPGGHLKLYEVICPFGPPIK